MAVARAGSYDAVVGVYLRFAFPGWVVMPSSPRTGLVGELEQLLGRRVHSRPEDLVVYECDGLTLYKTVPLAVTFPETTEEVAGIVRLCTRHQTPFVPRGAGTGLSGGAKPVERCVLIATSRMRRILHVDVENRYAVVQPGLVNIELTQAVAGSSAYYAPDPSSQMACTIGGNVAENAGGPHCLKHGMTTRHILGLTVVLPSGDVARLGGPVPDAPGYDLVGLFVGSEGTLGIATEITVRIEPQPQSVRTFLASYARMRDACATVTGIIASGVDPAALEILDRLTIEAVESSVYAAGYPREADAVLLVELDGMAVEVDEASREVARICRAHGALAVQEAREENDRKRLWKGRKGAFGAMGRINTDLLVMDGVVPRHRLEWILEQIYRVRDKYGVTLANVFHAGDGNLHPNISYDGRDPEETARVLRAGEEILYLCIEAGGVLSGEHGIGVEKRDFMPYMFDDADLELMRRVRDMWNPHGLCNPQKVLPTARACVEARGRMLTLDAEVAGSLPGSRPEPRAQSSGGQS
ncbi:MAG: FAD-linked oxidase C-terminal domain-containing protein [Candidatus Krumholzibacteriia bacterium]